MNSFSVYHQVYNNKKLTKKSLASLRYHFPHVKILLISDGGANHADVAEEYQCDYTHDDFNTGVYCNLNPKVISGEHIYGWTKTESFVFLNRIYNFCKNVDTKYMLFTEDDIIFNKPFTIHNENFDLTGRIPANYFPNEFLDYMKIYFPNNNLEQWGCCAGNFLNVKSFIYCYDNFMPFLDSNYDHIITNVFHKLGWCDVLFNVLYGVYGMKYINNYDYSETDESSPIYHDKITSRVRNN